MYGLLLDTSDFYPQLSSTSGGEQRSFPIASPSRLSFFPPMLDTINPGFHP
jgi:hypothetical protein